MCGGDWGGGRFSPTGRCGARDRRNPEAPAPRAAGGERAPPAASPGMLGGPRENPGWADFLIRGSQGTSPLARAVTWIPTLFT